MCFDFRTVWVGWLPKFWGSCLSKSLSIFSVVFHFCKANLNMIQIRRDGKKYCANLKHSFLEQKRYSLRTDGVNFFLLTWCVIWIYLMWLMHRHGKEKDKILLEFLSKRKRRRNFQTKFILCRSFAQIERDWCSVKQVV